jgi:small-conductance mechanosensitive channel
MIDQTDLHKMLTDISDFFVRPNAFRSIIILTISLILAYWLSNFVAKFIIKVAQIVAVRSDNETNDVRVLRYRQIETYLSVTVAAVRVLIVMAVGYLVWTALSPFAKTNNTLTAIGAGTVFVVIAGQTVGILLRDLTAGATIILEQWFNVGDFIKIEPFADVAGVVERLTLRSTRLRSLSGEVVWIHNQQIMAAHVTPRGVRTLAVDVFVKDRVAGEKAIDKLIGAIPTGPTMLAKPLRISYAERWEEDLWRITVVGQTAPGREWLIEKYFVNALKELDEDKPKSERLMSYEPIARFADAEADRRFKRSVRVSRDH